MADILDKINFDKSDRSYMINHIEGFPDMCRDAWEIGKKFALPSYYIKAKKFVLVGMGGSGIAADIIADMLTSSNIVVEVVHDYDIPAWVDEDTIVIATSYSGNTEETLSALIESNNLRAKLIIITTGGKINILADKYKAPCLTFDYKCVPRASFPYLFVFLLSIFIKLGQIDLTESSFLKAIEYLETEEQKFKVNSHTSVNMAKSLALKFYEKIPVIYASGYLKSVARRFKSQINENAKNLAFYEILPELNHNALEGVLPNKNSVAVAILESNYDFPRNIKRQNITAGILRNNKITCERVKFVPCESQLAELLTMVLFGDFVSYYLAILNKVDPTINDNITELKEMLGK